MIQLTLNEAQAKNLKLLLNLGLQKSAENDAGLEAAKAVTEILATATEVEPQKEDNNAGDHTSDS